MSSLSATTREVTRWTGLCVVSSWEFRKLFVEMVCRGWWGLLLVGISCLSVEFLSARWG
jgi:hypothetical protein